MSGSKSKSESKRRKNKNKNKYHNKKDDASPLSEATTNHDFNKPESNIDHRRSEARKNIWQDEKQRGNKSARNVKSIMENDLLCKRESQWFWVGCHRGKLLVVSPNGKLFSIDRRSRKVCWSTPIGKPLHVSYQSSKNNCSYIVFHGGYRRVYKQTKDLEPVDLECDASEFVANPYKYLAGDIDTSKSVYGDIDTSKSVSVIYVNPETGRRLSPLTSDGDHKFKEATTDSSSDKILRIKRFDFQVTCNKPGTDIVLSYRRIAKIDIRIHSRDGARVHEKNDVPARMGQTLIKPGKIDKISWSDRVISKVGKDTFLVQGEYQHAAVIVCIEKGQRSDSDDDAFKEEISILSDVCNANHNFVKVYGVESDRDFNYVATEYCDGSLHDFILSFRNPESQHLKDHNKLLNLIRGIVTALACLHNHGISHGNLHLNSIFVDKYSRAKILVIRKGRSSFSKDAIDDMLKLGHIIFFCFTGVEYNNENLNNPHPQKYLKPIYDCSEVLDLLRKLLYKHPAQRPTAEEVYNHPLFWDSDKILSFIRDVSERLEVEWDTTLSKAIQNLREAVFGHQWDTELDSAFLTTMGEYRKYKNWIVRDLLRIIRNPYSHNAELTQEIYDVLGPIPTGFASYFRERFPRLVIKVHNVMKGHCGNESLFQKYFRNSPL